MESLTKLIIIKATEVNMEDKNANPIGASNIKERTPILSNIGDRNIVYNVELATSQANAISNLLPKRYSMVLDRTVKSKRTNKKSTSLEIKHSEFKEIDSLNQ